MTSYVCIDDIFGNLKFNEQGAYCVEGYQGEEELDCLSRIKERDYRAILENKTLEYTTPVCALLSAKTEREACIQLNEYFIRRLRETGAEEAETEIEKHKSVYTNKEDNYCLALHSATEKPRWLPSGYFNCMNDFLEHDFEYLKEFAGKEINKSDCY